MGKASSSKKVARAASTSGGRTSGGRTPWGYYLAIGLIVVLGTAMVYASRQHRVQKVDSLGGTPPAAGTDHWHVAYGFYLCNSPTKGDFISPLPNQADPLGIHTHADGVIHVHPYVKSAAGKNAVLDLFAKAAGVTLDAGRLRIPSFDAVNGGKAYSSHDYHDSDGCNGKPGRVQVQVFKDATDPIGTLWTGDPQQVPLIDKQLITIAFMPKGATIPPPPADNIKTMESPNDIASITPTSTTVPGATTTTVPGAPTTPAPAATATTAPAATTSTAPGATTSSTTK